MASLVLPSSIQEPDKLGTLVLCRQAMDEFKINELRSSSKSILNVLTPKQLKTALFVGINYIRQEMDYNQFSKIKKIINKISTKKNKKLHKKNKNKKTECNTNAIPTIHKNASLSMVIPKDILSNYICHYLDTISIYQLSMCDRKLSIICHTPSSIISLKCNNITKYRYCQTEYNYILDNPPLSNVSYNTDVHLIRNIEQLSITIWDNSLFSQIEQLKYLKNIKDLTVLDLDQGKFKMIQDQAYSLVAVKSPFMLLKHVTFENSHDLPFLLSLLNRYYIEPNDYHQSVYNLKSISFLNCRYDNLQEYEVGDHVYKRYQHLLQVLLPSKPNQLKELKFENSFLQKTIGSNYIDHHINPSFVNINTIKKSLAKLEGLVYSSSTDYRYVPSTNIFKDITVNITRNFHLFSNLKSLHIHTDEARNSIAESLFRNTTLSLFKINEICISIGVMATYSYDYLLLEKFKECSLNKICLVIKIEPNIVQNNVDKFIQSMKDIFMHCVHLKLLQIVFKIHKNKDNDCYSFCENSLNETVKILKGLNELFHEMINGSHCNSYLSRPLILKLHIKSSHYDEIDSTCSIFQLKQTVNEIVDFLKLFAINYLSTFPTGKLQIKYTYNTEKQNILIFNRMLFLNKLFDVQHITMGDIDHLWVGGEHYDCLSSIDHIKECISLQKGDNKGIQITPKWSTDCQFCDNTPWF